MIYNDFIRLHSQKKVQFNYNTEKCIQVAINIIEQAKTRDFAQKLFAVRKQKKVIYGVNAILLFTPLRLMAVSAVFFAAALWIGDSFVRKLLVSRMVEDESIFNLVMEEKAIIVVPED